MRFFKYLGLILSIFFIGSSNYILYLLWNNRIGGGFLQGLSLYILAGITYLTGIVIIGVIYLTASGRRDIPTGLTLLILGVIHFIVLILTGLSNLEALIIWAPQTGLSIFMGGLLIYLSSRKLRRRLVEIGVPVDLEY